MLAQMPPPHLKVKVALFLDFNGTLAPIVGEPVLVEAPARALQLLDRLKADLDRLLSLLYLPVAGVHDTKRRSYAGRTTRGSIDDHLLFDITRPGDEFVRVRPGLFAEQKSGSVTLHYASLTER